MLIGLMFVGLVLYSLVNLVVGFVLFFVTLDSNGTSARYLAVGAVVLALVGLGAGIALAFMRRPWFRGLGLGLMIGWALWSIMSAGFFTGLNPNLYD
ncbi:hypothetical protein [Nonomuraea jiangxiensis]|uniref:Uncharacterized protein n=1 Tax=Nonomuraea jiangxiensis TaxID=633440 RepID=A0A1G9HMA1_9ACTN|nr:hypothetical protein [Nonomuraea jiangxiensis]SDL14107.1 hypothetical protein SAMN05421869_122152 [Nonomuraea jiangxiensis]